MTNRMKKHIDKPVHDAPHTNVSMLEELRQKFPPNDSPSRGPENDAPQEPFRDRYDVGYETDDDHDDDNYAPLVNEWALSIRRCEAECQQVNGFRFLDGDRIEQVLHLNTSLKPLADVLRLRFARWLQRDIPLCNHRNVEIVDGAQRIAHGLPAREPVDADEFEDTFPTTGELLPQLTQRQFDKSSHSAEELLAIVNARFNRFCLNLARAIVHTLREMVLAEQASLLRFDRDARTASFVWRTCDTVSEVIEETEQGRARKRVTRRVTQQHAVRNHSLSGASRFEFLDALNAPTLAIPIEIRERVLLGAPESARPFITVISGTLQFATTVAQDVGEKTIVATEVSNTVPDPNADQLVAECKERIRKRHAHQQEKPRGTKRRRRPFELPAGLPILLLPCDPAVVIAETWAVVGWGPSDMQGELERRGAVRANQSRLAALREHREQEEKLYQERARAADPRNLKNRVQTIVFWLIPFSLISALVLLPPGVPLPRPLMILAATLSVIVCSTVIFRRAVDIGSLPPLGRLRRQFAEIDKDIAAEQRELVSKIAVLGEETPLR